MFEWINVWAVRTYTYMADVQERIRSREDGQGTTEYAMVIAFVVVGLTITLGLMGTSITNFLGRVAGKLDQLVP